MTKKLVFLGATLVLLGVALAGCADDVDESTNGDPDLNAGDQNVDCEDRNLVDDDIVSDDDGVTLGECEEFENEGSGATPVSG